MKDISIAADAKISRELSNLRVYAVKTRTMKSFKKGTSCSHASCRPRKIENEKTLATTG